MLYEKMTLLVFRHFGVDQEQTSSKTARLIA